MKYTFTLLTGFFCVAVSMAQGPRKVEGDKIVGIVGDKIISQSDILSEISDMRRREEPVPEDARCMVMERLLTLKTLVHQAEKDSVQVDNDELEAALNNQIRAFIKMYGSEEAVCAIAGRAIHKLKEDFRQPFKERMMAERLTQSIVAGVKITPQEVKEFFARKDPESLPFYASEVEIGEIVVYPKASLELEKLAMDELDDFKEQVEKGSQKFDVLARMYSDDPRTKDLGGELVVNRNEKVMAPSYLEPGFIGQVFRLREGQISKVFKTKSGYHIVQLIKRKGDDATIRHILRIPKITNEDNNLGINKLDSVRARLIAGTISFGEAVGKYSEADTRFAGGIWPPMQLDQLDKDMSLLLEQTKLKAGQFSKPMSFVDPDGRQGVRIVYLKSSTSPHRQNLKDDYNRIAEEALTIKKHQALEAWFVSKIPTYYIMIDPEFRSCSSLKSWMQVASAAK